MDRIAQTILFSFVYIVKGFALDGGKYPGVSLGSTQAWSSRSI